MKDKLKSRVATGVVVVATIILAGVAIFTAMRLYKLRNEPVAPTAPSTPSASTGDETISCQELAFTISEPSATPTGSVSPSATPTATATPTSTPTPTATATPTSTATPTATNTPTSTPTPTPTDEPRGGGDPTPTPTTPPSSTSTPTPTNVPQTSTSTPTTALIADSGTQAGTGDATAQLPAAGVSTPTIIAISLGMLLILFALVLAI